MRILGVDPGTQCGYAHGPPGLRPASGTIRLDSKMSNGRRFCALEGRIRNLIAVHEIDEIYVEAPYIQTDPSKFDIKVVRLGYGYQAAILMAADKEGIGPERIYLVEPGLWRSHVLKVTRAPKGTDDNRAWLKRQAVKACDERGWPITSEDQAEACCIWEFGCESSLPQSTMNRLPLFAMTPL